MGFFSNDVPSASEMMSGVSKGILKNYPQLAALLQDQSNSALMPTAQAELDVAQQMTPQYNQLMLDMYKQFAPQLADVGIGVGKNIQLGQAQNNADVANSDSGRAALDAAINADRTANPEFYSTRELEAARLSDLLKSIDLTGGLSGSENRALDQSIARQNQQLGMLNAPSAINAASNAMQYGEKTYERQQNAKNDLNKALTTATSFLPASKSGIDAWNIATGGPDTSTKTGAGALGVFQGLTTGAGASGAQNTGNLLNTMFGSGSSMAQTAAQAAASQPTGFGNLMSGLTLGVNALGAAAKYNESTKTQGSCWVAREVYGIENPAWLIFREWMLNDSPSWFRKTYLKYGERFAAWLKRNQWLKPTIKMFMDKVVNNRK